MTSTCLVVVAQQHGADPGDGDGGGRDEEPRREAAAAGRGGLGLDAIEELGAGRHAVRLGLEGSPQDLVVGIGGLVAHRRASRRSASAARARWRWVFTDPALIPRVSAISVSDRSA